MSFGSNAGIKEGLPVNLSNAVAAGTSLITTNVIDLGQGGGFNSIAMLALLGAVVDTAQVTVTAYGSTASDGSNPVSLGASSTIAMTNAANSNTVLAAQVIRTSYRYVYFTITRATANTTLQGAIGFLNECRQYPPNFSGLVGGKIHTILGN